MTTSLTLGVEEFLASLRAERDWPPIPSPPIGETCWTMWTIWVKLSHRPDGQSPTSLTSIRPP